MLQMIKKYKFKLILSSLAIFLPTLIGVIFWDKLPELMPSHIGLSGTADAYAYKSFSVYIVPCILLVIFWVCLFFTSLDKKNRDQNTKAFSMIMWIMPIISLYVFGITCFLSFGNSFNALSYTAVLFAVLFMIMGNYLPKCKQNYTLGIKIKWTLQSEKNWNATHRFGGKVWFICGICLLFCAVLPMHIGTFAMLAVILAAVIIPTVYSYRFYKKQLQSGETFSNTDSALNPAARRISIALVIVILLAVAVVMFTGGISLDYGEESFEVSATYHSDITVNYSDIESIEYRALDNKGTRVMGFASARLLLGSFENEEFGTYTRYSYTSCKSCVVITVKGEKLVLNGKTDAETEAIYDTLYQRAGANV